MKNETIFRRSYLTGIQEGFNVEIQIKPGYLRYKKEHYSNYIVELAYFSTERVNVLCFGRTVAIVPKNEAIARGMMLIYDSKDEGTAQIEASALQCFLADSIPGKRAPFVPADVESICAEWRTDGEYIVVNYLHGRDKLEIEVKGDISSEMEYLARKTWGEQ